MPTIADNAICLRRWDFSETSQTVSLFTREHGLVRGLAKGAKRERGSFSGGIDPLTRGQIVLIVKPGRELATLTQWTLEEVYWTLRRDLAANRAGLYMADLVHHMLGPNQADPHPIVFDALAQALSCLETRRGPIGETLLSFQWALLRETGYEPRLEYTGQEQPQHEGENAAADVYHFSPAAGGLSDVRAPATWGVRRETIDLLRTLDANRPAGERSTAADAETVERANRLLAAYIREILGEPVPTLAWIFPQLRQ